MPTLKPEHILLTASLLALSACAPTPLKVPLNVAPPPAAEKKKPTLPNQELNAQTLYQYLVGEVALQRSQPELAAEALLDLAKNSRDPRLAKRATETAIQGRQISQAIEAAMLWQSLDPDSLQANQAAAALLLNNGRLSDARPYLEKIIADGGEGRATGLLHLNQMLARQSNRQAVLELVRALVKPYPEIAEAHIAIAQAAWSAGNRDETLAELSQAENLRPGWETAALFRGLVLQQTSVADALAFYKTFLHEYPKAKDVRLAYARLLVSEKQYRLARAEFQRVVDDAPDNPDVNFAIGLLAMQEDDFESADSHLRQALGGGYKDGNAVRLYLGQVAEERKRFDEAAKWYDSVEQGDLYINARIRHAGLSAKQGKMDEARLQLQQTQTSNNQQRALLIQAEAQLLREEKKYQEAFDVLGRGLEKLPNHAELLYDHAMAAEKLDKLDVMEKDLRHVFQLKPDNAHAYNALGYTFAERGIRLPEALELVEKATALAPQDPFIMDSLGWVYFRLGQHAKALETLRRALELSPDPEIAAHLGEVLWTLGQHDEARATWRSALKRAPENEALLNAMQKFK